MLNLLVPVSDRDQNWYGLHAALGLAKRFNGHVDLVFVQAEVRLDIRTEEGPAYVMPEILARLKEEAGEKVAEAERTFAGLLQEHNVPIADGPSEPRRPTASWTLSKGTVRNAIERWGGVHDATVFARAPAGGDGEWRENVETALFTTGQPVLLVPFEDRSPIGETVLIGWNRSAQSARALRDALPLLERAKNVFIFSVKTGAKEGPSPQDAGRHLERHGIKNEVLEIAPSRKSVGKALIAQAHEVKADLMVMGAYSHSRFREAILGGVTRQVLAEADLPVLMSH
jgi:nucleotide-binding universal stress UspA family protein